MKEYSTVNNIKSSVHSKPILSASLELTKNNCESISVNPIDCYYDKRFVVDYDLADFDYSRHRDVIREFIEWIEYTESHVIVLRNLEDGKRIMILEWNHRWKKSYIKTVRDRFKTIADSCEYYNFIHMVITIPHKGSIDYCMHMLKKAWKLLHDLLVKRYGKFMYVAVLEPHRDGYPHLHILIFCNFYLIKHKELSRYLESKGVGKICYIKRYWANRYGRKPIYYLTKYLSKYWNRSEWTDSFMVFSSYLWKTRTRSISFSRGFGVVIDKKKEKEKRWCFWFVCEIDELEYQLNLANIKLNSSIKLRLNDEG